MKISRYCLLLLFMGLAALPLAAEVVFMRNGEVLIGDIVSAGAGTLTVRNLGNDRVVPSADVLRTEPDLSALTAVPLHAVLKNGAVIKGTVVDFDDEIGLFVDIGFGIIALPPQTIDRVLEPVRAREFSAPRTVLGIGGGAALPLSDSYSASWGLGVNGEFLTPWLEELYIGIGLNNDFLSYTADERVDFMTTTLALYGLYKIPRLFPFPDFLVPYVSLGAGAALVQIFDERQEASVDHMGLLTGFAFVQTGIEWRLPAGFMIRTSGGLDLVLQEGGPFLVPKARVGVTYGF